MYVFSKDKAQTELILSETSSGGVCVNDTIMHLSVATLPFGGVGNSGMGSYNGKHSFDTFTHKKSCLVRNYNKMLENVMTYVNKLICSKNILINCRYTQF